MDTTLWAALIRFAGAIAAAALQAFGKELVQTARIPKLKQKWGRRAAWPFSIFEPVYGEVLFLDMRPADGIYEPLVGYIVLEQAQAAVDMLGLRLVHVKKSDLK